MTVEQLAVFLEMYGSDPRRWPEADRAVAEALILKSPEAQELHARVQALDNLLDTVTPLPADDSLRRRILTQIPSASGQSARGDSFSDWVFGRWWPQVAALAAAAVLGVVIGGQVLPPPIDRSVDNEGADWVFGGEVMEGLDR